MPKKITDWAIVPETFGLEYAVLLFNAHNRAAMARLCRLGRVPCKKIGRKWIFDKESAQEFFRTREAASA